MRAFVSGPVMEIQLRRAKKELEQLKQAKMVIKNQQPIWKHYVINTHGVINIPRNSLIEQSGMYYPWYSELESKLLYDTLLFLEPFTIRLYLVHCNKTKPYRIQYLTPSNTLKAKDFSSLEKAAKFTNKLKKKVEKWFEDKAEEIDKYILLKEVEVKKAEHNYNVFTNTENNQRQRSVSSL